MNLVEKIEQLLASDITSYRIAKDNGLSPQYIDNYRVGNSKIENMALGKAETLINYWEEIKMKEKLTVKNLYFTHFDNDIHTLEFHIDDKKIFVNYPMEATDDEFFWDNEENVRAAVENGEIIAE
ncbi:hypothetical protein HZY86_01395 [Aerococcaceae bacterium DSM 111020]|nr:hypothetical protein [Aerococcaceae bacterium DSM 111020]